MFKAASLEFRLNLIRKSVCLFFIAGILLSFKLWISNRFFPLAPVAGIFSGLSSPFDIILICVFLFTLLAGIFFQRKLVFFAILFFLLLLALQDQNRWQAWVYIYGLMCIPFLFDWEDEKAKGAVLNYLQIIFIGVYVWSGIHKFNPNFLDSTFQRILTGFFKIQDPTTVNQLKHFGYAIPCIEILIGLSLLIPRLRNIGVILVLITHVFILLFLSPLGINSNSVVYPWNIAMVVFVFLLFYKTQTKISLWSFESTRVKIMTASIVLLTWILPALNLIGYWDNYLSFSLYSDKLDGYYILIDDNELLFANPQFKKYMTKQGTQAIDVTSWSLGEMNSPIYPETRVFNEIGRALCKSGLNGESVVFIEYQRPFSAQKYKGHKCKDFLK